MVTIKSKGVFSCNMATKRLFLYESIEINDIIINKYMLNNGE
mgnify:CR=1 FL=1